MNAEEIEEKLKEELLKLTTGGLFRLAANAAITLDTKTFEVHRSESRGGIYDFYCVIAPQIIMDITGASYVDYLYYKKLPRGNTEIVRFFEHFYCGLASPAPYHPLKLQINNLNKELGVEQFKAVKPLRKPVKLRGIQSYGYKSYQFYNKLADFQDRQ